MSLKDKFNVLLENLKFSTYSRDEAEIETIPDSSQTSTEKEVESPYITYNPYTSYTLNSMGQEQVTASNRNESIMRWRQAAYLPEVEQAINKISNEAIVYDEFDDPIQLNTSDIEVPDIIKEKMQESFNRIIYMLDFNERGDELFRQWYVDGQLNIEAVYDNQRMREGIKKLILLTPFNFNTLATPSGEKKYFFNDSQASGLNKVKEGEKIYTDEQITHINSGIPSLDKKFHVSYLNSAMKAINQLNLIEDSLVIARITKATEKRAFYLPIKGLNKYKAEEYMQSMINKYRQKRIYNLDSGTIENRNRSISVLEDFWFPVDAQNSGPRVENIAGTAPGFTSFEDVDYYVNKVYKSLRIPLSRRVPDGRLTVNNQVDIEKDELEFFKFILKLRRRFNNLFVDLLKKDLLARKVLSIEDWMKIQEKIKFTYSNSNEYSEIKANQILDMRIATANSAMALVQEGLYSKLFVQKKVLRLTDEEIKEINQENAMDNAKKEDEEFNSEIEDSPFSKDYDISRRGSTGPPSSSGSFSGPESPEEIPEPPANQTPPKGDETL
jgi:hypothetical protein